MQAEPEAGDVGGGELRYIAVVVVPKEGLMI